MGISLGNHGVCHAVDGRVRSIDLGWRLAEPAANRRNGRQHTIFMDPQRQGFTARNTLVYLTLLAGLQHRRVFHCWDSDGGI